jgi:hypothetical protein
MDAARMMRIKAPRVMAAALLGERHVDQRLGILEHLVADFRREIDFPCNNDDHHEYPFRTEKLRL